MENSWEARGIICIGNVEVPPEAGASLPTVLSFLEIFPAEVVGCERARERD